MPEDNDSLKDEPTQDDLDIKETIMGQPASDESILDSEPTVITQEEIDEAFDPAFYSDTRQYEILEPDKPLGRGGFGTVWKVKDKKLDNIKVMKRLHSEEESGKQGIIRFINEAKTIASLNHQNIITVYDVGKDKEGYYIIAEYVDGGTLKDLISQKGHLSQKEAINLIEQVGRALSYSHKKGVIHRDIKPQNILLTRDGIPKVADFGLARTGRESDLSQSGMVMGSIAYMPPEQRKGERNVDHRADIYTLGKTLYYMITGKIPETIRESEIPSGVREAILKSIEPLPEDRYFTIDEFIKDLKEGKDTGSTRETVESGACHECGIKNPADTHYCEGCGAGLFEKCPACDREKRVGITFCGGCGTNIPEFNEIEKRSEKVQKYLTEKRYADAQKESQKILSSSPHSKQQERIQKYLEEAENNLKKIEELKAKADDLYKKENYEDAKSTLNQMTKLLRENETQEIDKKISEIPALIKDRNIRNLIKEADQLVNAKKYADAILIYQRAIDIGAEGIQGKIDEARSKEIQCILDRGKSFVDQYDFEKAIETFREILVYEPNHEEAKIRIKEAEETQEKLKKYTSSMRKGFDEKNHLQAENFAKKVLSINPNHSEARSVLEKIENIYAEISNHLEKARAAIAKEDYAVAEKSYKILVTRDPLNEDIKKQQSELNNQIGLHCRKLLKEAKAHLSEKDYLKSKSLITSILDLRRTQEVLNIRNEVNKNLQDIETAVSTVNNLYQSGKYYRAKIEINKSKSLITSILDLRRTQEVLNIRNEVNKNLQDIETAVSTVNNLYQSGKYYRAKIEINKLLKFGPHDEHANFLRKQIDLTLDKRRKKIAIACFVTLTIAIALIFIMIIW